ncbi:hypothetical protein M3Y95_01189000 [Aphelenchoides besseyi]|nr:hypothetical protein M3Y95_01189000 [Aphelenchoides besseyi]
MKNVFISSCSRYLWSLERAREGLIFRRIDIETLDYVEYPHRGFDSLMEWQTLSFHFQSTSHGTFIFFSGYEMTELEIFFKCTDDVYRFHFNEDDQCVELEHVKLPLLPTAGPYPTEDGGFREIWCTGLVEINSSFFFYRIDYFGDLHVFEWKSLKGSFEWTRFSIEGNYRPKSFLVLQNRDFTTHKQNHKDWCTSQVRLFNCRRFYLDEGVVLEDHKVEDGTIFYKLQLQPADHNCKCEQLFQTRYIFAKNVKIFITFNETNGSTIFLVNGSIKRVPVWSVIEYGQVWSLRDLSYWAVRRCMISEHPNSIPTSTPSSLSTIRKLIKRIFKRPKKQDIQKRDPIIQEEDPLWPEQKSILLKKKEDILVPVNRVQILYLLKKFRKIGIDTILGNQNSHQNITS